MAHPDRAGRRKVGRRSRLMRSRPGPAFLLSLCLAACTTVPSQDLRLGIEDRPAEGVIRVSNPLRKAVRVFHPYQGGFGDLQMLQVRFRDARGRIIDPDYGGWYTPLSMTSDAYEPGEYGPRKPFVIPGGGFVDLHRDLDALTQGLWTRGKVEPPCEMQVKLSVYVRLRTNRRFETLSGWQPGPCPRLYVPPVLSPKAGTR